MTPTRYVTFERKRGVLPSDQVKAVGMRTEVDSASIAFGGRLICLNIIPNRECT
jgi:hypothetical protein